METIHAMWKTAQQTNVRFGTGKNGADEEKQML